MRQPGRSCAIIPVILWMAMQPTLAAQTNVAVAANFTEAAKEIAAAFKAKTGDEALLSFGSSGQLVTQISEGAPFQVFLSADAARPDKLVADGLGVPGTVFTYAVGRLVLWSKQPGLVEGQRTLEASKFDKLSICNPAAAPYGEAAVETMRSLKLYDALRPKFVVGANITQAYQFVQSGNAALGFVAYSQVIGDTSGSRWMVPQTLYRAIRQDAVLLETGQGSAAAKAFLQFLEGPEAKAIIEKYGYAVGAGQ